MPTVYIYTRRFTQILSPALGRDRSAPWSKTETITLADSIKVKSRIIPGAAESEIMREPSYADNWVAAGPLHSMSDTDKCLSAAAPTTFYEPQPRVDPGPKGLLLLLNSGLRQTSNKRQTGPDKIKTAWRFICSFCFAAFSNIETRSRWGSGGAWGLPVIGLSSLPSLYDCWNWLQLLLDRIKRLRMDGWVDGWMAG